MRNICNGVYLIIASLLLMSANDAYSQDYGLGRIEGTWNNNGGDNIQITRDQLGGWNAWLGAFGEGNIIQSTYKGGNIKVEAGDVRCWFRATILAGGNTMNWKLVASDGDCSSMVGYFARVETASSDTFTFKFCNKTSSTVNLATVGRRPSAKRVWLKEGWWVIEPGNCKTTGKYLKGTFYYFGETTDGSTFGGGEDFCAPADSFRQVADGNCGSNENTKPFKKVYVDASRYRIDGR